MESKLSGISAHIDQDFNSIAFEKKLLQLKDSQESINHLSAWCLDNRQHHKKIVTAWLNVLKKVKVEQRLTLFYLANDVIQYSKRKNYDFVGSWSTSLQKATTMVREEKVKNKILRIFKIWEQRGIYGEEFIADLSGLISASPLGRKPDSEPQDFQPSYLIQRIRSCAKLEENTDLKLKVLKENSPKIIDSETLLTSLKDRRHVEDVEREVEEGITLIEEYVNALKSEIKSRTHLISVLGQAEIFYHTERGEVKVVANAYRNFSIRVKNHKKKLDELIPTLSSPIPSPDINAPSPEPDSDIELPNLESHSTLLTGNLNHNSYDLTTSSNVYPITENYSAGYYNPVQTSDSQEPNFNNQPFQSFINSNTNFNIPGLTSSYSETTHDNLFGNQNSSHLPQHDTVDYGPPTQIQQSPLLPPPLPPFTSSNYMDPTYNDSIYATTDSYGPDNNSTYPPVVTNDYAVTTEVQAPYIPSADAYNPEEDVETWESEGAWNQPPQDMETPESPPIFEKEGFADPIEYDDSKNEISFGKQDIDQRQLLLPPPIPPSMKKSDHRLQRNLSKDVDQRNLITLTGSPTNEESRNSPSNILPPPPAPPNLWSGTDQDYRTQDQDYRTIVQLPKADSPLLPVNDGVVVPNNLVDIAQQLQLPPPPPPPPLANAKPSPKNLKKMSSQDNVESIDMDLSDDEINQDSALVMQNHRTDTFNNNSNNINRTFGNDLMLEPPPPIPQNLCDDITFDDMTGKNENGSAMMDCLENNIGSLINENMIRPGPGVGPVQFLPPRSILGPGGWGELGPPGGAPGGPPGTWFENRPVPPEMQNNRFPPPMFPQKFRGTFRGRGVDGDIFRGRGDFRGRGNRGNFPPRGMRGNWMPPNRGNFRGGNRGFRGQFRGGFQ